MKKFSRIRLLLLLNILACSIFYYQWNNSCSVRSQKVINDPIILRRELNSSQACIRSQAASDIQKIGSLGADSVPRLIELLQDKDDSVRWRSVAALGYIGTWNDEVLEAIYPMTDDPHEIVRYNAIFALGHLPFSSKKITSRSETFKMPEKLMQVFLKSLYDYNPQIAYKAIIHTTPRYVKSTGEEFEKQFIGKLKILLHHEHQKLSAAAFLLLLDLLPEDTIIEEYPDVEERLETLFEQKHSEPLAAKIKRHLNNKPWTTEEEVKKLEEESMVADTNASSFDVEAFEKLIEEAILNQK